MEENFNIDESSDLANWMRPLRFALSKSEDKLQESSIINNLFADLFDVKKIVEKSNDD